MTEFTYQYQTDMLSVNGLTAQQIMEISEAISHLMDTAPGIPERFDKAWKRRASVDMELAKELVVHLVKSTDTQSRIDGTYLFSYLAEIWHECDDLIAKSLIDESRDVVSAARDAVIEILESGNHSLEWIIKIASYVPKL
ncbi:hypothetical protein HY312_02400 [Candidatus Saccharibacteria bacterium]|nr:hypothetical protein [Candidatus Saccharibacteria bacterium]